MAETHIRFVVVCFALRFLAEICLDGSAIRPLTREGMNQVYQRSFGTFRSLRSGN